MQQHFVSLSYMFQYKTTVLNLGLNVTIFWAV